jgi:hypothetical protein
VELDPKNRMGQILVGVEQKIIGPHFFTQNFARNNCGVSAESVDPSPVQTLKSTPYRLTRVDGTWMIQFRVGAEFRKGITATLDMDLDRFAQDLI